MRFLLEFLILGALVASSDAIFLRRDTSCPATTGTPPEFIKSGCGCGKTQKKTYSVDSGGKNNVVSISVGSIQQHEKRCLTVSFVGK